MLNHSTESARSVEAVYSRGTEMIDAGAATMMRSEVTALDVAQVPRRRGFPEPLEMEQVMVAGDRHHREWPAAPICAMAVVRPRRRTKRLFRRSGGNI